MWNKQLRRVLALLLAAVCLAGCLPAALAAEDIGGFRLSLKRDNAFHNTVLSGYSDGSFRPEDTITRAEACVMLYGLLQTTDQRRVKFADVAEDSWYYDAIGLLAADGILDYEGFWIRPDEPLTRGELVAMAARLSSVSAEQCSFADVPITHPYYAEIAGAEEQGWISGYADGTFQPDAYFTRAQTVVFMNRVLDRQANPDNIHQLVFPLFSDVSSEHWAYYEIIEAAMDHTCARNNQDREIWIWMDTKRVARQAGLFSYGADLYFIDGSTGLPRMGGLTVGGFTFAENGRYTCGDAEIDAYVHTILSQIVTVDMTQMQKLRAAYNYVRDSYTYLRRNYYQIGDTGWELEEARTMYSTGRGNCYCYAAVFYYLARQLGFDARIISGVVGYARSPHGWVEIDIDGETCIFDTELEMSYRKKGVTSYNFFQMPESSTPWPYIGP